MDHAIPIKLTEKQYHILSQMAKVEYRTIGNMVGALIAEGISFYLTERNVPVKKMQEDWTREDGQYEYYTDGEVQDALVTIAVLQ